MNRNEYIKCLQNRLKRLPKEDFDRAISYFTEYFDEAGPDKEMQAIEDLGTPEAAADQIIRDFAAENAARPAKNVKQGFSAVWVGILAVFAAPIALPLALAFGVTGFALVLVVITIIFCIFISASALAVCTVPCIFVSVWMIFTSFADGIATLGLGLCLLGGGILLTLLSILFGKWFLHGMTRLFGLIAKGGKTYEK